MDAVTRDKVHVVTGDAAAVTAGLEAEIAPDELLTTYGGQHPVPVLVPGAFSGSLLQVVQPPSPSAS
jgi:hypothetical protein